MTTKTPKKNITALEAAIKLMEQIKNLQELNLWKNKLKLVEKSLKEEEEEEKLIKVKHINLDKFAETKRSNADNVQSLCDDAARELFDLRCTATLEYIRPEVIISDISSKMFDALEMVDSMLEEYGKFDEGDVDELACEYGQEIRFDIVGLGIERESETEMEFRYSEYYGDTANGRMSTFISKYCEMMDISK